MKNSPPHHLATPLPHHLTTPPPHLIGWLLDEARATLGGQDVTIIETAPPRAAGPLGAWRVLRCRLLNEVLNEAEENGAPRYELLVAREQLPKENP